MSDVRNPETDRSGSDPAHETVRVGALPVEALLAEAEVLTSNGKHQLVIALYRVWLENARSALAYAVWFNYGVVLAEHADATLAIAAYEQAIALNSRFLPARLNLGTLKERLGRPEDALQDWNSLLSLPETGAPDEQAHRIHALNNLGRLLEILKRFDEAEAMLAQSLVLDPEQPDVRQHWIHLRQKQCRWPVNSGALALPEHRFLRAASALSTLSLTDDPFLQREAAQRFVDRKLPKADRKLTPTLPYGHERLRIGYVSSDFCLHPVSLLMAEVFERHDRNAFEIFGFCHSPEDGSDLRHRVIAAFDQFHRISGLTDAEAAKRIRDCEIDILIDLQGLTAGVRAGIFSFRPAPVQVTWLGFPGTSGHPDIDYIIADAFILPENEEHTCSEKPLRLTHCFQPSDNKRSVGTIPTRADHGLPEKAFVYCCFNNNYKISDTLFNSWMEILHQVPNSVLWVLADNEWSRANMAEAAARHGIDADRLIFAGRVSPADYLARYALADLFLDTFPFNAGTTANDALWMGLPLLTHAGRSFASRMAGSLLMALDLPELIAESPEDYVAKAIHFGHRRDLVTGFHDRLLAQKTTARLYDMGQFTADLEEALRATIQNDPALQPMAAPVAVTQVTSPARKKFFAQINSDGKSVVGRALDLPAGEWSERFVSPRWLLSEASFDHGSRSPEEPIDLIVLSHLLPRLSLSQAETCLGKIGSWLAKDGLAVIICPDMEAIAAHILARGLDAEAYRSDAGPITAIDMMFGHQTSITAGRSDLAHHSAYTLKSLSTLLRSCGFTDVRGVSRPAQFDFWTVAGQSAIDPERIMHLMSGLAA